jgi:hypothetical protein
MACWPISLGVGLVAVSHQMGGLSAIYGLSPPCRKVLVTAASMINANYDKRPLSIQVTFPLQLIYTRT